MATTTMVVMTPKRSRIRMITIFGILASISTIVNGPTISRGILVTVAHVLSSVWGIYMPSNSWGGWHQWLLLLVLMSRMHH